MRDAKIQSKGDPVQHKNTCLMIILIITMAAALASTTSIDKTMEG